MNDDELKAAGESVRKLKRGRTLLLSRDPQERKAQLLREGRQLASAARWQAQQDELNRWHG